MKGAAYDNLIWLSEKHNCHISLSHSSVTAQGARLIFCGRRLFYWHSLFATCVWRIGHAP